MLDSLKIDFRIAERVRNFSDLDTILYYDTVTTSNFTIFEATPGALDYQWQIGDDPRTFTGQKIALGFDYEERLPVTLIARSRPNLVCFPDDDGVDTVVHYLTVVNNIDFLGNYVGSFASTPHLMDTVRIWFHDFFGVKVSGINKGCEPDEFVGRFRVSFSYKFINITTTNLIYPWDGCHSPSGWIEIDRKRKMIHAEYTQRNPENLTGPRIKESFTGTRITD